MTADGPHWQKQRLLMAPALRIDMLDAIIPITKNAVDRLCKNLESFRGTGTPGTQTADGQQRGGVAMLGWPAGAKVLQSEPRLKGRLGTTPWHWAPRLPAQPLMCSNLPLAPDGGHQLFTSLLPRPC